jgi:photosystem II stability/assembly factor-like uncharacterized protein
MDGKKKLSALIVCGALVVGLGAVSASAANPMTALPSADAGGKVFITNGTIWSEEAPEGVQKAVNGSGPAGAPAARSVMIKEENGVKLYSVDGGKTWSRQAPDGYSEQDGKQTLFFGTPPREGEGGVVLNRVEDGVKYYSTDGGKTWSKQSPAK